MGEIQDFHNTKKQISWKVWSLFNLKGFTTITDEMKKHVKDWLKKLQQGSRLNILQAVDGLHVNQVVI